MSPSPLLLPAQANTKPPNYQAELGAVFYSIKEKGYDARSAQVHEREWSRRKEIEAEMEVDRAKERERVAREENAERERVERARSGVVGGGSGGGVNKMNGTNGAGKGVGKVNVQGAVRKPIVKRKGRGF